MRFQTDRLSFVDDEEKARDAADRIRRTGERLGARPIVVSSCVDPTLSALIAESGALVLDVFNRLKSSQFAPLLNQAAERKYQGESLDAIVNSIFPEIVTGVSQAFKGRN